MTTKTTLATIPKRIKVGPHTYAIALVDRLADEETRAQIDTAALTIEIVRSQASAAQVVDCLIHELFHAIWADRDLGKRADEERIVFNFGGAVVQLFQDNPGLLTWISRGLKPAPGRRR